MTRTALLLASMLVLTACTAPAPPLQQRQIYAFGTLIDVSLYGVEPRRAEQIFDLLTEKFNWMHAAWHAWRPGTLSRTNAALQAGRPFLPEPGIRELLRQAQTVSLSSHELFNPAIGRLIELWGFHQDNPAGPPPSRARIEPLLAAAPSMADIHFDGDRLYCSNPAVQLDLGGFAKGYGVDRAIELLREEGIENAVINAGGDLRAIGQHGDRPWRIGIRNPFQAGVIAWLDLQGDESVFSSGDYERNYQHAGRTYQHILDPRTGEPAVGTTAVTVIHDNATEADAAATALLVAGEADWLAVAQSMGIRAAMLIKPDHSVLLNPAMQARVQFRDPATQVRLVYPPADQAGNGQRQAAAAHGNPEKHVPLN